MIRRKEKPQGLILNRGSRPWPDKAKRAPPALFRAWPEGGSGEDGGADAGFAARGEASPPMISPLNGFDSIKSGKADLPDKFSRLAPGVPQPKPVGQYGGGKDA